MGKITTTLWYLYLSKKRLNVSAYNLADAGFDVWMGNARGNRNSRFHINLDANERDHRGEFFDFSWEEIGMIDIPSMVDYVLEHTGKEKLHYLGHSQGGTVFLVLNSMRPEYNEKFASVNLMAGVGYMEYFPNNGLSLLARFTNQIYVSINQAQIKYVSLEIVHLKKRRLLQGTMIISRAFLD